MNKLLVFFCLIVFASCQRTSEVKIDANLLVTGEVDSVYSTVLNEYRKFWVHVPKKYDAHFKGKEQYPIVYLLDGDSHFQALVGLLDHLIINDRYTDCPEMIVVGVLNTNRNRDLTPTFDRSYDSLSGGNEAWIKCLESEIMPYIQKKYNPAPYRTIIGHSLGGLTVVNLFLHHNQLFNNYIAIDPSLWWNHRVLTNKINADDLSHLAHRNIAISLANNLPDHVSWEDFKRDSSKGSEHMKAIVNFIDVLSDKNTAQINLYERYYDDESHGSVPFAASYDALRYLFSDFYNVDYDAIYANSTTADMAVAGVKAHFKELSRKYGYNLIMPERLVNELAYNLLREKEYDKSYAFFQLNIEQFPESSNVYDSMGDFFKAIGKHEKARIFYEKSIEIDGNPESAAKLKQLPG